ncbi:DUF308 domain-containing protein [Bradyrhizobium sp. AUGA SZCCT0182]|nr:DUF308 domain-containing protein [Bradyrhizobium sp. AUGA SZCCT0182]
MMVGMLVAGTGLVLAGLLAIGYGITINEFSTGNTLILSGVTGFCTGAIMLGLGVAVRELKNIAWQLGAGVSRPRGEAMVRPVLPPGMLPEAGSGDGGVPFKLETAESAGGEPAAPAAASPSPPPWQGEAATRERPRSDLPTESEPAEAAPKPKRNLLFSSTSRKERERAQARTSEPLPPDLLSPDLRPNPPAAPPPPVPAETQPPSFDDAWPKPERSRPGETPPPRRAGRTPPAFDEPNGAPPRNDQQPAVTVLKSGVVDGMAYSLYSDGSIEAQMPEGMMRFASIDELRTHLDQRP